jgi:hypothetical protein
MHPSPVLLDFRLTVLYHGLKATQYFSKFTEESISVLKEDLLTLGLPHPRKENITLLSHGLVECFWPSARKNHVRPTVFELSIDDHLSSPGSTPEPHCQDTTNSYIRGAHTQAVHVNYSFSTSPPQPSDVSAQQQFEREVEREARFFIAF